MASQSLYRKWRSQTFSDLIGQDAVVRTLLNAVRDGRLAHAYLFCGPRGTGKTSMARLLAKAINCEHPNDGEPCNTCTSCIEIASGRSPDVIEIDAASNNGVDDVRKVRETANLMGGGRSKVYIVDEVHMLSTPAFNALLKTLEEPPPHVIFVLATTEAHKVLPTVVSRCQRFDFRRFRKADIVARLKHVAEGEKLTLEPAAADLLARAAQGGMRDALSLLDQAVAFCGERVDLERTRAMLGLADVGAIRRLIVSIADDRAADALDLLNDLVTAGADLRQLNSQLADEWRALMLSRAGADLTRVMDYTEEEARELTGLAGQFSLDELMACARVFARNEGPARGLPVPQLALELSLLECASIRRTGEGEQASAAPSHTAPRRPTESAAASAPPPPQPRAAQPATPPPPRSQPAPVAPVTEELDLAAIDAGTWAGPARGPVTGTSAPPVVQAPRAALPAEPEEPAFEDDVLGGVAWNEEPVSTPVSADGRDWAEEAQRNWPLIRKICRQKPPMGAVVGGLLSAADPIRYEPGSPVTLVIAAKFDVHLNKLRDQGMREVVEWALEQALGVPFRAHFVPVGEPQRGGATRRQSAHTEPNASVAQAAATPRPQAYERASQSAPQSASQSASANGRTPASRPASQPGPARKEPPAGRSEIREQPAQPVAPTPQLEQAARQDPVVQEFAKMLKVEVADVRALDAHESHESHEPHDTDEG